MHGNPSSSDTCLCKYIHFALAVNNANYSAAFTPSSPSPTSALVTATNGSSIKRIPENGCSATTDPRRAHSMVQLDSQWPGLRMEVGIPLERSELTTSAIPSIRREQGGPTCSVMALYQRSLLLMSKTRVRRGKTDSAFQRIRSRCRQFCRLVAVGYCLLVGLLVGTHFLGPRDVAKL